MSAVCIMDYTSRLCSLHLLTSEFSDSINVTTLPGYNSQIMQFLKHQPHYKEPVII